MDRHIEFDRFQQPPTEKKKFKHYKGIEILAFNSKGRANPAHHAL